MSEVRPRLKQKQYLMKGTAGARVYDEIEPQEGDIIVEKCRFSAFWTTDLDVILRSKGKDTVVICGANTHMGCESTARDAQVRDYRVVFLSDGNLAADVPDLGWGPVSRDEVQRVTLAIMADAFARVMTIDDFIAHLQ